MTLSHTGPGGCTLKRPYAQERSLGCGSIAACARVACAALWLRRACAGGDFATFSCFATLETSVRIASTVVHCTTYLAVLATGAGGAANAALVVRARALYACQWMSWMGCCVFTYSHCIVSMWEVDKCCEEWRRCRSTRLYIYLSPLHTAIVTNFFMQY